MKKLIVFMLLLGLTFSVFAGGATEQSSLKGEGPIKIGSIQDLSGGASTAGQPNAWGAEYAVKVINEKGGINGRMLEITTMDCKNDAAEGVMAYRKLVDEVGVAAIIGPPLSNPAAAWVELSEEDSIPIVGHFMDEVCTTNPDTGKPYPYMFLAEPSSAIQSYCMAEYALTKLGAKTAATLYNPGNAFAKSQAAPFVQYMNANGGKVVSEQTFSWTDKDYSAQAIKIVAAKPDVVFLCDYLPQNVTSYDALRDAGFKGAIIGANTLSLPFATMVKNKVNDVYFLQNYDMLNSNVGNINELVTKHMKETGTAAPAANVGFGWDAVQVLAQAMRMAKDPTDGKEVADLLRKTDNVMLSSGSTITIDPATHRPSNMGMYIADYDEKLSLRIVDFIKVN
ncbi:ABC transporter substrate-binding protein [Sphaerochaeta globosa]|uniref:Extracellular ligand-binding receptor n=1 Tax=Sphaerochaeta globosa (strain ATCC BAA-1886 / DSM 22777 / Buddy) TaxID=158189 RepID=F0RSV7_SPHGB|nr:ABC transporter substrate-binding protein [Sphaerochaeta globosa]ADY14007.1 Extracellular ligand-binding receptor [Sphaerochaeta globosa str. Buddy]